MVINCELLFESLRKKKNQFWLAAMILILEIRTESKYKIARKLIKDEKAFDWFLSRLGG